MQVVEPLAIRLSAWGQTRRKKNFFVSTTNTTSAKSICSLALFIWSMFFPARKILILRCFGQLPVIGKPITKGWFWQTSRHFSTFFTHKSLSLSNRAHAPVNTVGGDPRCCTEEGICRIAGVPLPGLQKEMLCETLKMGCHLVLLVCWHYLMFFFFWHTGRSRKAPEQWPSPTLGTSERTCQLFLYHKAYNFFTWRDAVLTLDTYKYCNMLAMVVMAGPVSTRRHYCEEIRNIHCCIFLEKIFYFCFNLFICVRDTELLLKKQGSFCCNSEFGR